MCINYLKPPNKEKIKISVISNIMVFLTIMLTFHIAYSQQVEVQGELKVTQMTANDTEENLVTRKTDGTLGTRSVASLPPPPPPIDTTRNLASDFELAKQLCNCPNLPPFMIKKLLNSGYTPEELVNSGVSATDVLDAQRGGILIDPRDNQHYKTVTIGTQTWMAENLNFGTRIEGSGDQLDNSIIEKYCYDNDPINCTYDGALYQWNEMMQYSTIESTQGICPSGWHLPSDNEWKTLEMTIGLTQAQADATGYRGIDQGSQLAGDQLYWNDGLLDQSGVFGSSGFEALPMGYYNHASDSFGVQFVGSYLWTSTNNSGFAWSRYITWNNNRINRFNLTHRFQGYAVRCVKD